MGLAYSDFQIELSRHERREREAINRINTAAPSHPNREVSYTRERTMAWFREWREHMWRCYDAQ